MIILRTNNGREYIKVEKSLRLHNESINATTEKVWIVADGERIASYENEAEAIRELDRIEKDIRNNVAIHEVINNI